LLRFRNALFSKLELAAAKKWTYLCVAASNGKLGVMFARHDIQAVLLQQLRLKIEKIDRTSSSSRPKILRCTIC
jgi:hypothetical protein